MRESELHEHIFATSADLPRAFPHVLLGPGDDCALVRTGSGDQWLLKVDQLVEGRHFTPDTPVDLIARKAIARSVSDIAAMAGEPRWGLASAVLPPGEPRSEELCNRLAHWGRHFGCPLVGGDLATGAPGSPLSLSITVGGVPSPGRGAVTRDAARPGDELWVTGHIGSSFESGRHLRFEPRVAEARFLADALAGDLHAMLDISDGLGRDAGRLAARSRARFIIDADRIPLNADAPGVLKACRDGEDYELLFTTAPGRMDHALADWRFPIPCTRIGRVEAGAGCVLEHQGRVIDAAGLGWDH